MAQLGFDFKDDGMRRAMRGHESWKVRAVAIFRERFKPGDLVTGEVVRMTLGGEMEQPRHPSAWSALVSALATLGMIEDTGRWKFAVDPKAHARRLPIWRVT